MPHGGCVMINLFRNSAYAVLLVFLAGCQTTDNNIIGEGPITLDPHIEQGFDTYLNATRKPTVFAVAVDGSSGYGYWYCKEPVCTGSPGILRDAVTLCEKRSKGVPCKVFAIYRKIVWKGPVTLHEGFAKTEQDAISELEGMPKLSALPSNNSMVVIHLIRYSARLKAAPDMVGAFAISDRPGDPAFQWRTREAQNNKVGTTAYLARDVLDRCQARASDRTSQCKLAFISAMAAFGDAELADIIARGYGVYNHPFPVEWEEVEVPEQAWITADRQRFAIVRLEGDTCLGRLHSSEENGQKKWTARCDGDLQLSGTYTKDRDGSVTGKGRDSNGRPVSFRLASSGV